MPSARARLVAPLVLAMSMAVTLAPAVTSSASAAPATVSGTTTLPAPAPVVVPTATSSASTRLAVLRNPVTRGQLVVTIAAKCAGIRYVAGGKPEHRLRLLRLHPLRLLPARDLDPARLARPVRLDDPHLPVPGGPGRPGLLPLSSGRVYHVAIYAGSNTVWHSPYPGKRVMRERIWTSMIYFGRLRVR